ncbi:MAG TPA: M28 family peptidase [Ktedonobacterales bacterium]
MREMGTRIRHARVVLALCLLALVACAPVSSTVRRNATATPTEVVGSPPPLADFPTVDPAYIYDQLAHMATSFPHREAGYDNGLPPTQNGHDEFAAYWAQEIQSDLAGFGPTARRLDFAIKGWVRRPAVVPAFNMEVSVPGAAHPEQVVVIGCHYDSEASSTQSANDDASGCAIELGVAKALGTYWRAHHAYPARTLRFVLFDAEEQGLFGSFDYVNNSIAGDRANVVAMFNEEQNGIAYPLRFLGKASNPLLPFYMDVTPLTSNPLYPQQSQLTPAQVAAITRFRALLGTAAPAVFQQFRALGQGTADYFGANGQAASQPIFTPGQQSYVTQEEDTLGSSDQVPFTLAGIACDTLVGNSTYYDPQPLPWSYPYDQPQDTIQLMNVYAHHTPDAAPTLKLALALPGMVTGWMLAQPDVLGTAAASAGPIAAISDVGQTVAGQSLALDGRAAFDPAGGALSYRWSFGDGASATGPATSHTYAAPGTYALVLTVQSPGGTRQITKSVTVTAQAQPVTNPYADYPADGNPPHNPNFTIPPQTGTP